VYQRRAAGGNAIAAPERSSREGDVARSHANTRWTGGPPASTLRRGVQR
jgi:hypothetical protein